jgi:hypothetical protein
VRRIASTCLGALSHFLSKEALKRITARIFKGKPPLTSGISGKDFKDSILRVQTLSLIYRSSGNELDESIGDHSAFLLKEISLNLEEDRIEQMEEEHISMYVQLLFQILETFLKNSDKVFVQWLKSSDQIGFLTESINRALKYNPNMPEFLEYLDDEEDDEGRSPLTQTTTTPEAATRTPHGRCAKGPSSCSEVPCRTRKTPR